jgi:nitrite reductase/ring-hydroxylating ferredoxin subunit
MAEAKRLNVCTIASVPLGEMRCVSLPDRNVLVAHTKDGVFVADEMCTHEDARLCDGNLSGTRVKCPLHGSRFELTTGKVLDDPAEENLGIYPVTLSAGMVTIMVSETSRRP